MVNTALGASPRRSGIPIAITPCYLFWNFIKEKVFINVLIRRGGAPPGAAAFIIRQM